MANTENTMVNTENTNVVEIEGTVLKLKKPVEINGELTKEIPYDLESLTGNDISDAIKMLASRGIMVTLTETDSNYHAAIFAISTGLDFSDIQNLSAKDYQKACNIVRDFFLE